MGVCRENAYARQRSLAVRVRGLRHRQPCVRVQGSRATRDTTSLAARGGRVRRAGAGVDMGCMGVHEGAKEVHVGCT